MIFRWCVWFCESDVESELIQANTDKDIDMTSCSIITETLCVVSRLCLCRSKNVVFTNGATQVVPFVEIKTLPTRTVMTSLSMMLALVLTL